MRGFRGSRSAQNQWSSRHGRSDQSHFQNQPSQQWNGGGLNATVALPDWLKTPETKAREAKEARHPHSQKQAPKPAQKPVHEPVKGKPQLKLIGGIEKKKPAAKKKAATPKSGVSKRKAA